MAFALVAVGAVGAPPVAPLGVLAAALLAIVLMESVRPPEPLDTSES